MTFPSMLTRAFERADVVYVDGVKVAQFDVFDMPNGREIWCRMGDMDASLNVLMDTEVQIDDGGECRVEEYRLSFQMLHPMRRDESPIPALFGEGAR